MTKDEVREIAVIAVQETLSYKSNVLKSEIDKRHRNVKLLMRNYRKLKKFQDNMISEVLAVESVSVMKNKTDLMMCHVNKMLVTYKALCMESNIPEQRRRWQSLYLRYIDEGKMRVQEIADFLKIDKRTLYRDLGKAMSDMAILLFGIEAMEGE